MCCYTALLTNSLFHSEVVVCNAPPYGQGDVGDRANALCPEGQMGSRTAECQATGEWRLVEDACILTEITVLVTESQVGKSAMQQQFCVFCAWGWTGGAFRIENPTTIVLCYTATLFCLPHYTHYIILVDTYHRA